MTMFETTWRYDILECPNNSVCIKSPYSAATFIYEGLIREENMYKITIRGVAYIFEPHDEFKGSWKFVKAE